MRITEIEPIVVRVNHRGDWVFVHVHTDEGITGLGEASHSGNDALCLSAIEQMAARIRGRSPLQIEAIWQSLNNKSAGRVEHTALSGIEQALWDVLGQFLGTPIRTLLGGAVRDRIRLYANINRHVQERSPEGFARAAAQAVAQGFTAVKLAPFDELRNPDHIRTGPKAAWRTGVERVRAVRQAVGQEVEVLIDCHGRMEASEAIAVARELEDVNLFWYEEPVPHLYLDELARVTANVSVPTASAESVYGMEGFRPFLTRHIVDVIMPDVKHCGGLGEMKRIAGAARMSRLLVAPHNPSGPVAAAASAQAMSTERDFLILEYAWGEADWRAKLIEPAERIEGGYLFLPDGPGLGHRLNKDIVAAHRATDPRQRDAATLKIF
ncbi:MAG: mandelate racemase/muconate lactonizing enzyme family protein [Chloroflexi bacterium]|nr:mandelate racemase/muconate lactonizing enzyme family protein [Chloroflexota bacterium]